MISGPFGMYRNRDCSVMGATFGLPEHAKLRGKNPLTMELFCIKLNSLDLTLISNFFSGFCLLAGVRLSTVTFRIS